MNVDKADEQLAARKHHHHHHPRNINPNHDPDNNKLQHREHHRFPNRRRPVFIDTLGYKEDNDDTTLENEN
jgi:hypothetical protein